MPRSSPTSQQNVTKRPRDTHRLAVASGSKVVPHLQTVHPGGTPFSRPAAGITLSKISCPQKGYSPPRGQSPPDISPPTRPGAHLHSHQPGSRRNSQTPLLLGRTAGQIKQQIQCSPGLTLMATKHPLWREDGWAGPTNKSWAPQGGGMAIVHLALAGVPRSAT